MNGLATAFERAENRLLAGSAIAVASPSVVQIARSGTPCREQLWKGSSGGGILALIFPSPTLSYPPRSEGGISLPAAPLASTDAMPRGLGLARRPCSR